MIRHLLGIRYLERAEIQVLLGLSREFKRRRKEGLAYPKLDGKSIGLLFFEDSTRTRVAFEQAAYYLGMHPVTFTSRGSSMSKGESLKDTILTLRHAQLDGIVMRHPAPGAPQLAARFFEGPIFNAGDGEHEHPAQALGDALTILEHKGHLEGLIVAIVGDVAHSRVARSNAWLLAKMGAEVRFVGPKVLMPTYASLLPGTIHHDLASGLQDADIVMCLRLQKERMLDGLLASVGEYARLYQIDRKRLELAAPDCLIMHPGPINRGVELDDDTADSERSLIREQVENGIWVRMAAYAWAFGLEIPAEVAA